MTARVIRDDDAGRAVAIEALREGGVIALPTDTVYGIAVTLDTPGGIERLFQVKRRPPDRGIILLLDDAGQAARIGIMTPAAAALAAGGWPGGLTVVVPQRRDKRLPEALTGGAPSIGLRVPDHDAPRSIARAIGPLPTTSANISGLPEAGDAATILEQLGDDIDLILDGGPAPGGPPSTIVECTAELPTIIREGAMPRNEVVEILDAAGVEHDLRRD